MKALLATLALLPVIASHAYLQLPQLPVGSPAHYGVGSDNDRNFKSSHGFDVTQRDGKDGEEGVPSSDASAQLSGEASLETGRDDQDSSTSTDFRGNDNMKYNIPYHKDFEPWRHLPLLTENHFEELTKSNAPVNPEVLAIALREASSRVLAKRSGAPSSFLKYFQPSAYIYHPMYQQSLSGRPLALNFLEHSPNQRFYDASLLASLKSSSDVGEEDVRPAPSKRYLGIELPDYIASTKAGNQQLHQLKQRMRSVGK